MKFKNVNEAQMNIKSELENFIRDHLSGTNRAVKGNMLWQTASQTIKGATKNLFDQAWQGLIDDGLLVPAGGKSYKWER